MSASAFRAPPLPVTKLFILPLCQAANETRLLPLLKYAPATHRYLFKLFFCKSCFCNFCSVVILTTFFLMFYRSKISRCCSVTWFCYTCNLHLFYIFFVSSFSIIFSFFYRQHELTNSIHHSKVSKPIRYNLAVRFISPAARVLLNCL